MLLLYVTSLGSARPPAETMEIEISRMIFVARPASCADRRCSHMSEAM